MRYLRHFGEVPVFAPACASLAHNDWYAWADHGGCSTGRRASLLDSPERCPNGTAIDITQLIDSKGKIGIDQAKHVNQSGGYGFIGVGIRGR